ncbi:MAG: DNA topoisomerase 3 [Carnobacterium sp.]|uniref:type IA DNA topoisomerase n=1 Tax=Carnobacterium sp. TaxID=48221 RepID=UPI003C76C966
MGLTLILAEKPSQALAYAESFGKFSKKEGYIVLNPSNDIITWGFGHLVELASPEEYKEEWKKWNMKELPIIPQTFKFKVGQGKAKQFTIVKKLLKEAERIIIATDSDREGENIARSIINQAQVGNKEIKRLWINSLESDEIQKGFSNLREGKEYYSSYIEAQTRQISDWLIGMNLSRMYTLTLQKKGINQGVFSVGRVQTPTLYLIYTRQKEIENFVPEVFYELFATIKAANGVFKAKYNEKFPSKKELQQLIKKCQLVANNPGVISNVEMKHISKPSLLLFSLSDLQSLINKKYKVSPADTLKHVQFLYEAKIISYPRSDCRHITDSEFRYLLENLEDYQGLLNYTIKQPNVSKRKRYVDGSKVQEHYAVIPTKKIPTQKELGKLTTIQKNIYFTVLRRTLGMFETDFKYDETTITVDVKSLPFISKGRTIMDKGWRKLEYPASESSDKKEHTELPFVQKNEAIEAELSTSEGFTTPPKLYTEGTLITAMKTCGKELENKKEKEILKETEGIGTEATRANVLETLKKQQYIISEKNNVTVTPKGTILCQAVADTLLSSPEMTAKWENYLKKIKNEEGTQEAFLANIEKFIHHTLISSAQVIESLDWSTYTTNSSQSQQEIAKCPACGQSIVDKGKLFGCSGYSNGCTFTLPKRYVGKTLSEAMIKSLITVKETQLLKGFKKKDGKTFSAALLLTEDYKLLFKPYK